MSTKHNLDYYRRDEFLPEEERNLSSASNPITTQTIPDCPKPVHPFIQQIQAKLVQEDDFYYYTNEARRKRYLSFFGVLFLILFIPTVLISGILPLKSKQTMCLDAEAKIGYKIIDSHLMQAYQRELEDCTKISSWLDRHYECRVQVVNKYNQTIDSPPKVGDTDGKDL
jgi:hypothetical protein